MSRVGEMCVLMCMRVCSLDPGVPQEPYDAHGDGVACDDCRDAVPDGEQ